MEYVILFGLMWLAGTILGISLGRMAGRHVHDWDKWALCSQPMRNTPLINGLPITSLSSDYIREFQRRTCKDCGKIEERELR
jgi:hypothetical protein